MKRPTNTKLLERRREVASYALKGWTQVAIARHLKIPPATVSRDLAVMREFWREFPVDEYPMLFKEYLLLRDIYGDPPYKNFGGLTTEQIAALLAEHEREPIPSSIYDVEPSGNS